MAWYAFFFVASFFGLVFFLGGGGGKFILDFDFIDFMAIHRYMGSET